MFTQPKTQKTKINLHIKILFILSHYKSLHLCFFKKQRDDEDKRDAYARSKSSQKSLVQYFRSPSHDRTKHNESRYKSRSTYSQNRYRSPSRDRFSYVKSTTPPQNSRSRYNTYKRDSHSYRSPYRPSYRSSLDITLAIDIDHAPIQETIVLQDIKIHTDHLPDQAILDFLDPVHTPILEIKSIRYNHKTNLTL